MIGDFIIWGAIIVGTLALVALERWQARRGTRIRSDWERKSWRR